MSISSVLSENDQANVVAAGSLPFSAACVLISVVVLQVALLVIAALLLVRMRRRLKKMLNGMRSTSAALVTKL